MFEVGDILIKIDTRGRTNTQFDTRHHMMLVVKVGKNGHPIVAHMKFTNFSSYTGQLVIEPCPQSKELILVHCPMFTTELRVEIASIAQQAHDINQLRISRQFLEQEHEKASPYQSSEPLLTPMLLRELRQQEKVVKDVLKSTTQFISCHDFVLSTIRMACQTHSVAIPFGLDISPHLAWSNLLYSNVAQDKSLVVNEIARLYEPSSSRQIFFSPNEEKQEKKESGFLCIVM